MRFYKEKRKCLGDYSSPKEIWEKEKASLERATRLISHLTEEQMIVEELEEILHEIFEEDANVLSRVGAEKTNIRRLINIYDYLKWGSKKSFLTQALVNKYRTENPSI